MSDNTIHLWGQDGARAGSLTIDPMGRPDMSIVQVNIAVCGLKNFDFWWHDIYRRVQEILLAQNEAEAKMAAVNQDAGTKGRVTGQEER